MSDNATKPADDDAKSVMQDLIAAACELAEASHQYTGGHGIIVAVEPAQFRACAGELASMNFASVCSALHRILENAGSGHPIIATINLLISNQEGAAMPPVYTVLFKIAALGLRSDQRSLIRFGKKLAKAATPSATLWLDRLTDPAKQLPFVFTLGWVETFRDDRNCKPSCAQLAEVKRWWANGSFDDRLIHISHDQKVRKGRPTRSIRVKDGE